MTVEELVSKIDIVEYIGQYTDLIQRGEEYWCLSLFKEEKTPSFSVRRNPPVFYDYSSGKGGGLIKFVKLYNNCSGAEAIHILQEYIGDNSHITSGCDGYKSVVRRFAQNSINKSESKILDKNCMDDYYYDKNKLKIWYDEGISYDTMQKCGVKYDPSCNRIVYPIYDSDGNIVNIGGRTLDPEYKEKGLRKYTYYYKWGTMKIVYGLYENQHNIRAKNEVIVFEGAKSVMKAASWGIDNCVAILTSHLNPNQEKELIKLKCNIVFALDKDVNIKDDKNIKQLKKYTNVYYIHDVGLLDEKDSPVDKGYSVFQQLLDTKIKL